MHARMRLFTVCETRDFAKLAAKMWTDAEREEFVDYIAANPLAGDIIEGTGGVRKVRWSRAGIGKRGGVRVIYYVYDETLPLFLLTLFAKNESDDLSDVGRRTYWTFVAQLKSRRDGRN